MSYDDDDINDLRRNLEYLRRERRLAQTPYEHRPGRTPSGGTFLLFILVFAFFVYLVRVTWLKDVDFKPPENMLQPMHIEEETKTAPAISSQNVNPAAPTPAPGPSLEERVKTLLEETKQNDFRNFSSHTQPYQGTMPRMIKVNGQWVRERPDNVYNVKGERIYYRDERLDRSR